MEAITAEQKNNLVLNILERKSELIREAISYAMGTEDWELKDVVKRGMFGSDDDSNMEKFIFDGKLLLVFLPLDFTPVVRKGKYTLHIDYIKMYGDKQDKNPYNFKLLDFNIEQIKESGRWLSG